MQHIPNDAMSGASERGKPKVLLHPSHASKLCHNYDSSNKFHSHSSQKKLCPEQTVKL